jgi:hypothetical protein
VLQPVGNYGNTPFEFAPEGEPPFPLAGAAKIRKPIAAWRCDQCAHVELFAP